MLSNRFVKWLSKLSFITSAALATTFVAPAFCVEQPLSSAPQQYKKPDSVLLTYAEHPQIETYKTLLSDVYNEMGIAVHFQPVPAGRGLLLVDSGSVDGDVARVSVNARSLKNSMVVQPSLLKCDLVLVCTKGVACNQDVLKQRWAVVLSNLGNNKLLEEYDIDARVILNEQVSGTIEMFNSKRVSYLFYIQPVGIPLSDTFVDFNSLKLREVSVNHIISDKHAALLPELERVLAKRLAETGHD
ncbi:hypothetical protein [Alteromonas gilva]|uniref:DUF2927 domain-containing protein n=1 Tax=Alteromonas gilva TaxID=2987522 RepID=A0ABT5L5X5_9ALTE|nr:hypothetical protein [Alteromonas gilva]MDC8832460.1 hypothetical protein [Alteromonas gilva]